MEPITANEFGDTRFKALEPTWLTGMAGSVDSPVATSIMTAL